MIEQLRGDYSGRLLCEALDVHRSSLYHESRPDEDRPLREALIALAGQWPTYTALDTPSELESRHAENR